MGSIRKAYAFLDTVKTGANAILADREEAFGEFVLAIRQDLLSRKITRRTELRPADFRHFKAN